MRILKERVDPQGQLNLEWRPVGNTRLEIRMPRPPQATIARREAKEAAIDRIKAKNSKNVGAQIAIVAVARKLTARAHKVLKEQKAYIVR